MQSHRLEEKVGTKDGDSKRAIAKKAQRLAKKHSLSIYQNIIKYQLAKLCKQNSKTIAFIFKMLIRDERLKRDQESMQNTPQEIPQGSFDKEF